MIETAIALGIAAIPEGLTINPSDCPNVCSPRCNWVPYPSSRKMVRSAPYSFPLRLLEIFNFHAAIKQQIPIAEAGTTIAVQEYNA